jgi:hypothetical protein
MAKQHPTNVAIGKNKGHVTTKLNTKNKKVRQSRTKGRLGKRVSLIRQVVG